MMLNRISGKTLVGGWFAVVAVIVAWSVAKGAALSTSGLLLVMGAVPVIIMTLIRAGASSPTVAEILRSVDAKDRRG